MELRIDGLYLHHELRLIKLLDLSESTTDPQDVRPEVCIPSYRSLPDVTRQLSYPMPTTLDPALVRLESAMDEVLRVETPADRPRQTGHRGQSRLEMVRAKEMDTD
jgi:Ni,Fe-hydrogenase maturation factor